MSRGKMMRRLKSFGRCRVQGHGQGCELNAEINERPNTRAREKRSWIDECEDEAVAAGVRANAARLTTPPIL